MALLMINLMKFLSAILRFLSRCLEGLGVVLLRLASFGVALAFAGAERVAKATGRRKYHKRKGFSPAQSVLPQLERNLYKYKHHRSVYGHFILVAMTLAIVLIWILFY